MKVASCNSLGVTVGYANRQEWINFCREIGSNHEKNVIYQHGITTTKGVRMEGPCYFGNTLLVDPENIVVPAFEAFSVKKSRAARLSWGAILAHEIAHCKGADEFDAYAAGRRYLRKNGLAGPSARQIFLTIYEGDYSSKEKKIAEKKAYGSAGLISGFIRAKLTLITEGRYMIAKEKALQQEMNKLGHALEKETEDGPDSEIVVLRNRSR